MPEKTIAQTQYEDVPLEELDFSTAKEPVKTTPKDSSEDVSLDELDFSSLSVPESIPDWTISDRTASDDKYALWKKQGTMGIGRLAQLTDDLRDSKYLGVNYEYIPVGGVFAESAVNLSIRDKAARLEKDDYGPNEGGLRKSHEAEVKKYLEALEEISVRGLDLPASLFDAVAQTNVYMSEYLMTRTPTGKALEFLSKLPLLAKAIKGLGLASKPVLVAGMKQSMSVMTKSAAKKTMAALARTGMQTAFMAPRVHLKYQERRISDTVSLTNKGELHLKDVDKFSGTAFLKSTGDVWIENIAEGPAGTLIAKGLGVVGRRMPKELVGKIAAMFPKNYATDMFGKGWNMLTNAQKRTAYHGALAEYGEERASALLKAWTGVDDSKGGSFENLYDKSWEALFPDTKDAMVELGVIGLFGGLSNTTARLTKKWKSQGFTDEEIKERVDLSSETERDNLLDEMIETGEIPEVEPAAEQLAKELDLEEAAESTADPMAEEALKYDTVEEFIESQKQAPLDVKTEIQALKDNWKEQGVKSAVRVGDDAIILDKVVVDTQSEGKGTAFMNDLIEIADKTNKTIALTPSKDFGATSVARLKKFYERFGFVANKGANKDYGISESMLRTPQAVEVAEDQVEIDQLTATYNEAHKFSDSDVQGLSKADGARLREETGLDKLDKPVRRKWETALKKADPTAADAIAQEVINNPRTLSDSEQASLVVRAAELANQHEALVKKGAELAESGSPDASASFGQADALAEQIEKLTRASDLAGTEAGRALSIRRMMVSRESFKVTEVLRKAVQRKGEPLTQSEKVEFAKLAAKLEVMDKKVEALQKDLEAAEERASRAEANKTVKKVRHSRKADKATIKKDRDAIKAELKKLGMRVNDISGVSVEASIIIGKLAKTYVQEGALTLDEVVKNVQRDVPDVSTRDVWDSISGRGRESRKKVKSEIEKRVASIKKQAGLLSQIEDAAKGIFDPTKKVNTDKEVKELRKKLNALRDEAMRGDRDGKRLDDIIRKIDEIRDDIEAGVIRQKEKKKKRVDPAAIAEAKKRLRDLRSLINANATLADLMEQLKTGKYKIQAKREVRIVSSELELARSQVSMAKKEIRQRIRDMEPMTFWKGVSEVAQFARTIKATADRSGVLRQAAWMASRMPVKAAKAVVEAERAAWSEDYYHLIDGQLRNIAEEHGMVEAGLELTETGGSLVKREEDFASDYAERIPGLGAVIKNSNRHMVTYLNMMRVESMKRFIVDNPTATKADKQTYAKFINVNSGRGDLGKFDITMGALSKLMFAPRFGVSRFQVGWMGAKESAKAVKSGDWLVAKEIGKDYGAYVGTRLAILAMLAAAFGDDDEENYIGSDWNDADFGKVVMGPMRLDMWSGHAQPARLLLSIADGTMSPYDKDFDPMSDIGRFLMYKLSPAVSTTTSLASSKDFLGRETPRSEILMKALMPIIMETALETVAEGRSSEVIATTIAGEVFGIGVGVYDPTKSWKRGTRTWTDDMKAAYGDYEPGRASTKKWTEKSNMEWTDSQKSKLDSYYWKLLGERTAVLLETNPEPSRKTLEKISKRARDESRREFQR